MNFRVASPLTMISLTSGSAGNCTWVGDRYGGVLIDCGGSGINLQRGLERYNLLHAKIDGILLTHEHIDHVGGASVIQKQISQRQPIPYLYATKGTWEGARNLDKQKLRLREVVAEREFTIGHLRIEAIPIPHDTREPVCYVVSNEYACVMVCTDLGRPTEAVRKRLRNCHAAIIEFNHDPAMLMDSDYPEIIKQRIRGDYGHLSNEQAYRLILGNTPKLQHLILGHLSSSTNTQEKAAYWAERARAESENDYQIHIARSREAIPPVHLGARFSSR